MELVIIVLLCILALLFLFNNTPDLTDKNERKIVPIADIQFSEQNFPSVVYEDIFSGPNVWQGGYNLDQGRPVAKQSDQGPQGQQRAPPPPTGFVKSG